MQKSAPRLMIIASMAIFGTIAPVVRNIPLSSGEIALSRALIACIVIGLWFFLSKRKLHISSRKEFLLLLISGMAMGINWVLLFQAYKFTTVSAATLGYYFAPIIVTVASPILFREKMSGKKILCFIMSTIGLFLVISFSGLSGSGKDHIGILLSLGAAVLYASVVLMNKYIKTVAGIERTFFQFIGAVVVMLIYVPLSGSFTATHLSGSGLVYLIIVGLIHTVLAYCLYFTALKSLTGQEASILSYIDPLVAVIISAAFLNESFTFAQLIGGILILGFALLNEIEFKKSY